MKRFFALFLLTALLLAGCTPAPEPITNQWVTEEEGIFYYGEAGEKLTGWQKIEGMTYYFAEDGVKRTGWVEVNGSRYYLGEDGTVKTGYQVIGGKGYVLGEDGAALNGYQVVSGNPYILNEDGSILTGWHTLEDKTYYLGLGGVARKGWQLIDGERYYFGENGAMFTGWKNINGKTYCFSEDGILYSGWITVGERNYYLEAGQKSVGWKTVDGDTYYFNPDGTVYTGWMEDGEDTYYFYEDGVMAVGEVKIEEKTYHFLANGKRFILVNPWNYIPDDYKPDLVKYGSKRMDRQCAEPMDQMLKDCRAAGHGVVLGSSYRTRSEQVYLHNRMVNRYLSDGYGQAQAKKLASRISAVPDTSEHQLGLAFDIVDSDYRQLDYQQAKMPTQKWLMENSWKYGFNLRYPTGKSDITGIIYEPWHYRYVGVELAKELYDRNICLEEYFAELTEQQTARREAKQQA